MSFRLSPIEKLYAKFKQVMLRKGERTCRYSVFSSVGGCLESRAMGLKEARWIARNHKKSVPGAICEIWQWDIKHEGRNDQIAHLVETI